MAADCVRATKQGLCWALPAEGSLGEVMGTFPAPVRHRQRVHLSLLACAFILGNLLNSLMVAGDEDDTEDGQEDGSPIELD